MKSAAWVGRYVVFFVLAVPCLAAGAAVPCASSVARTLDLCRELIVETELSNASGVPIVRGSVNGEPASFLIDTGTDKTLLSTTFTDEHAWKGNQVRGVAKGSGDSGGQGLDVIPKLTASIGNVDLIKGDLFAADLSSIAKALGVKIDGIVGLDILGAHPFLIDMSEKKFDIFWKLGRSAVAAHPVFPLQSLPAAAPVISLPVRFGQGSSVPLLLELDTGFNRSLQVTSQAAESLGILSEGKEENRKGFGLGGTFAFRRKLHAVISVGNQDYELGDASISLATHGLDTTGKYQGLIGNQLISRIALLLDVRGHRAYMLTPGNLTP